MIALEFGKPDSFKLKAAWKLLGAANESLFGQLITVPLFTKHRILSQIAGHAMHIVKFLPPLGIGQEDREWVVSACTDVIARHAPGGRRRLGSRQAARGRRDPHEDGRLAGMQVAVTGANGFVGSHIVWELLHRGYEVTALVGADIDNHLLAGHADQGARVRPARPRERAQRPRRRRRPSSTAPPATRSGATTAATPTASTSTARATCSTPRAISAFARSSTPAAPRRCRPPRTTATTPACRATKRASSTCAASAATTRCRRRWPRWSRCAPPRAACRW